MAQLEELRRENAKLAQQVRRFQDVVGAMRDEIADANAEILASRRLFEEQKAIMMQELHRERAWREELQRQLKGNPKANVGTNTNTDVGTFTTAEVATGTGVGFGGDDEWDEEDDMTLGYEGYLPPSRAALQHHHRSPLLLSGPPGNSPAGAGAAGKRSTGSSTAAPSGLVSSSSARRPVAGTSREAGRYRQQGPGMMIHPASPSFTPEYGRERVLQEFADSVARRVQYYSSSGKDLYGIFKSLGASSVDEVCANITEGDLVQQGVPVLKARSIMHLIMEHTATLLERSGFYIPTAGSPAGGGGYGGGHPGSSASPSYHGGAPEQLSRGDLERGGDYYY